MSVNPALREIDFPIVGSFRKDQVTKISAEQTINWYEVLHPYGKKTSALHPVQGLNKKVQIGIGPIRGSFVFIDDKAYFASSNQLFQMDTAYVVTPLSPPNLTTTTGFVRIVSNQTQIIFCDGVTAILYDTVALTLTTITFPAGVIPGDITYMDGYFIVTNVNDNRFYVSNLDDGSTWNALSFASINSSPTFAVSVIRLKRRLFLFGSLITEVWLDAGTANFPFRRDNNLLFEHGLEAVGSLVEGFDRLFYLSRDDGGPSYVKMVEGTVPVNISTYEIDNVIQGLSNTDKAVGMVYKIDGIIFYKLNVGGMTFVYNVTMSSEGDRKWHQEEMLDGTQSLANTHIFFNNLHFVGDYKSSNLYQFDKQFLTNDGEHIHRLRTTHVLSDPTYKQMRIDRFQVDMLQGVGEPGSDCTDFVCLNDNQDMNPVLNLSLSSDGGLTYHNFGPAEIGKTGQYKWRTIWRNLGVNRDNILRIESWNSVSLYILGAAIHVEDMMS